MHALRFSNFFPRAKSLGSKEAALEFSVAATLPEVLRLVSTLSFTFGFLLFLISSVITLPAIKPAPVLKTPHHRLFRCKLFLWLLSI